MAADDIIEERPVVATVLVAAVATVAYVALQLVLAEEVNVPQTAAFVLIFTVVYVGGNRLLQRFQGDVEGENDTADADDRA